jgi:hypothetical protein
MLITIAPLFSPDGWRVVTGRIDQRTERPGVASSAVFVSTEAVPSVRF